MQSIHLLGAGVDRGVGPTLDQQLQELDVVQGSLVDGVVLVVALVDLVGPLAHQVLDAVPGASLAGDVEQRPLLLPGQPVVLALLSKQFQDVHLKSGTERGD